VVQVVQSGTQQFDNFFSTPAFWNGKIYYHASEDVLQAFSWSNGVLSTAPIASANTAVFTGHGATPTISANGTTNGLVWEIEDSNETSGGPAILHAYDAINIGTELYNSKMDAARDAAGPAVKFTLPTVANGRVYVGTSNQLDVYGLF
jgi:outer membrane protein assembly factor BamB